MPLVIKRKVSLDFLGEEYKEAHLVFQSIPIKDFDDITEKISKSQEDNKATAFILSVLKKYFIEGQFPGVEKLTADDLDGLDQESTLKCFSVLTGQELTVEQGEEVPQVADLKDESKKPSTTEPTGPQN